MSVGIANGPTRTRLLAALLVVLAFTADVGSRAAWGFDCPRPRFLGEDLSEGELRVRAQALAEKEANDQHLIFLGRVRSARHGGTSREGYAAYLITFGVAQWYKGKGGDQVKLLFAPWCDGRCNVKDYIDSALKYNDRDEIIVAGEPSWPARDAKLRAHAKNVDGVGGDCKPLTLKTYSLPKYDESPKPESRYQTARRLLAEAGANKLEELRRSRVQDSP